MEKRNVKDLSFEQAMKQLEGISSQLEKGELSLEESILLYQQGMQLSLHCQQLLDNARQKIARLASTGEGIVEVPMDAHESGYAEGQA